MMKRLISYFLVVAMVSFMITACGSSGSSASETATTASGSDADNSATDTSVAESSVAESGENYNWSFSTTYGTGSIVVQMYERFAELANEYTDGAITITVFPDGTIASEDDALAQVSSGELEFCGTGTAPVYNYSPDDGWIIAPFLIPDKETYENVYNSDYWMAVRDSWATENNVLDLCGCMYRGARTLVSTKEVRNVDDLDGLKLRLNTSAVWNPAWQAIGATTVSVNLSELYTSMQTGVVEACENPLSESGLLNIPELAKYVVPTNHVIECACIFMSNSLYESLPEEYQAALVQAGQDAMEESETLIEEEESTWLQTYIDAGSEYVEDVDLESFRTASEEWWREMFDTTWTNISYDDCMALIESCSQ